MRYIHITLFLFILLVSSACEEEHSCNHHPICTNSNILENDGYAEQYTFEVISPERDVIAGICYTTYDYKSGDTYTTTFYEGSVSGDWYEIEILDDRRHVVVSIDDNNTDSPRSLSLHSIFECPESIASWYATRIFQYPISHKSQP